MRFLWPLPLRDAQRRAMSRPLSLCSLGREAQLVERAARAAGGDGDLMVYHTMTPEEEAQWAQALRDGSLFSYQCQDDELYEQMYLWRQAGHLLKEIGHVTRLSKQGVWAHVHDYALREPQEATA